MTGAYAASFLPVALVPALALFAFLTMGLLFLYVESDA